MALDKQMHVYSIDTSSFYYNDEREIHNKLSNLYIIRHVLKKNKKKMINKKLNTVKLDNVIIYIGGLILEHKDILYTLLEKNKEHTRNLYNNDINDKNIVSIFDSSLTRTNNMVVGEISKDIMIVKTYFFDVLEDIIKHGYYYNNEKYICFTASAGQIRTKKTVFIKEKVWNNIKNTITCGLSIEDINSKGGIIVNKYLAYLALSNSATDKWNDFDIDKCIVVDDFETEVEIEVDFINHEDYTITRKKVKVPIPHTDGAGIMLYDKTRMIRMPWFKGLLVHFDFIKFLKEIGGNPIIKDIYGLEHNVIEEDIKVIFTKSQFKMWKYYKSWKDYTDKFKEYKCEASYCNIEEQRIKNAKINYQMMQTLTDITQEELEYLCQSTNDDISNLGKDKDTMLKVMGVTKYNKNKNYYQKALEIYPELLSDTYSKETLKQLKKKLVKNGRSAKLNIKGKYTFLSPDMFAFCEWLFLGDKNPKGLLENGQVSCNVFEFDKKIDCLRSPHLYREHAVRDNIINDDTREWFDTKCVYTSVHDPISKILQFDVDGDKSLLVNDKKFIEIAERNMKGIVPLYYDMKKGDAIDITNDSLYEGLKLAYTGGNIGMYSNDITKIWNSKNVNLDAIKILCMESNFTID